jgi:hypothetical protein
MFCYEMVVLRQLEQDAMMWQTPALALTAEAFLLTIALGGDSSQLARLLSSGLSVVVSVLAIQLMAKHHFLAALDGAYLRDTERRLSLPPVTDRGWEKRVRHARPTRFSSYKVWQAGLSLFALVGIAIFVVALVHPAAWH